MSEVTYDEDVDILYVALADIEDGGVARSDTRNDWRIVDYDADGRLIGVEFINASGGIDLTDVPSADLIERLIAESGHPIKIVA